MLAKVWKKALFAVCILACIANVMYKLINRTSLDIQLKSIQEKTSFTDILENDEKELTEENLSETNQENENKTNEKSSDDDTIVVIY